MANHPVEATRQPHFYHIQNPSFLIINDHRFAEYHFPQQRSHNTDQHTIIAHTISSLLGFAQIQAAGNSSGSTFKLNPITASLFVISILGYHLAFRAKLRFPTFASQFTILMVVLGSFSIASLVSLLLPDSWWPLKCILYIVLQLCEFYQIIRTLRDEGFGGFFGRPLPPRYLTATRPLLPQTHMDTVYHANYHRRGTLLQRSVPLGRPPPSHITTQQLVPTTYIESVDHADHRRRGSLSRRRIRLSSN